MIRDADPSDAAAICDIYNHYVTQTIVTFEETAVSQAEMTRRIEEITRSFPWIVYTEADSVTGYAYAGNWKTRAAYRHTVELSIYIRHGATGRGIGGALMTELLKRLRTIDVHAVIGGASLPNPQSVALQEKFGFRKVAHFPQVGYKFGQWIDVGYWELVL
jgi:L-amino acid N-acyltransferase YncA